MINNDTQNGTLNETFDIILELYRGKEYCKLQKIFTSLCLTNFDKKVFTNKKNLNRTITNLLASWMFTLYSNYDFNNDPFFPKDCNYFDNLKEILYDYTSLYDITNKDEKINKIINSLKLEYDKIYNNIEIYKNSNFYKNIKNKYTITKKIIKQTRNNKIIYFYKFNLKVNFYITEIKLKNIINNIIIPYEKYEQMKTNYKSNYLDEHIWILLYRYQLLGSNNNQLGVLPHVVKKMENEFGLNIECFASAINTSTSSFYSIYYDIEQYFGSNGSFFNSDIKEGCYSFNPPYQKDIITNGIYKLFSFLDNTDKNLCFFITIPIWDNEGKQIMKENNTENNNDTINYNDMEIIQKVKESSYFYGLRMISKNDFTYIDHNFHLFKNKTIQNTYIIILSNFENNYIDIVKDIDFFSWDY